MISIFKKEINQFFATVTGYVVIGIFLLITGLMLWFFPDTSLLNQNLATLDPLFALAPTIFSFLIPAVTMKMIAEEKQTGTIEFLMTKPVSIWQIILGKYFASVVLILLALLPTVLYYVTIYQLGSPKGNLDSGGIIGSYIGLVLLGMVFAAIGLFASSLQSNQIISFLSAIFLCVFVFSGFDYLAKLPFFVGSVDDVIQMFGIAYHYNSISRGVVDASDLIYFLSVIAFFLFLTYTTLTKFKR